MPKISQNSSMIQKYNEFVRDKCRDLALSPMQDSNWSLVKDNWDSEQIYIEQDGKIVAVASLIVKIALGQALIYCPRGPVILTENPIKHKEYFDQLMVEIDEYAKSIGAFMLKMDPEIAVYPSKPESTREVNPDAQMSEPEFANHEELNFYKDLYHSAGFKLNSPDQAGEQLFQPRYASWLAIKDQNSNSLRKKYGSKVFSRIRLGEKKGVLVETPDFSKEEDLDKILDTFMELQNFTTERNNIVLRDKEYYKRLIKAYPGSKIFIASHEGEALAAAIVIFYGRTAWYAYSASSNVKRNYEPNRYMQWKIILWAIEKNIWIYDMGGVHSIESDNGLYRFKSSFTGKDGIIEMIGEFVKIYSPIKYQIFNNLLPSARKFLSRKKR